MDPEGGTPTPDKSCHHRQASETPLKWHMAGRLMVACFCKMGIGLLRNIGTD